MNSERIQKIKLFKTLDDILKSDFDITDTDLEDAWKLIEDKGGDLGEALVQRKILDEQQLLEALSRLYAGEEVKHPWLGAAIQEGDRGLEIIYTVPGSPAAQAGLQEGDIIESLNGTVYTKIGEIQAALLNLDYPVLVSIRFKRDGESQEGAVSLAERPYSPIEESLATDLRDNLLLPLFGMKVERTSRFLSDRRPQ